LDYVSNFNKIFGFE